MNERGDETDDEGWCTAETSFMLGLIVYNHWKDLIFFEFGFCLDVIRLLPIFSLYLYIYK